MFQESDRRLGCMAWLYVAMGPFLAAFAGPATAATLCEQGASAGAAASPVTYSGYVFTDVSLGGRKHHNAKVTISFAGNTADIHTFKVTQPGGSATGSGFCIDRGTATVEISAGEETMAAKFLPGQVFVSFDTLNMGIGFSSYIGPGGLEPAYPLAYDDGTVQYFTKDLSTPTNITGKAWSCIGYPPLYGTGFCTDPTAYPLKTNRGDFIIYNPYVKFQSDGITVTGDQSGTMNRGGFSIVTGADD
jgi:hypothetical protein